MIVRQYDAMVVHLQEENTYLHQRIAELEQAMSLLSRQGQDSLRNEREILRTLLNTIQATVFLIDTHGIILQTNDTVAARFGVTPGEMIGKNIFAFFPPDVAEKRRWWSDEAIRTK